MDRFIGELIFTLFAHIAHLKSNMDRFIAVSSSSLALGKKTFKIQYG